MKKITLLTIAVIALLLINLGTLGYLFFRRPAPHQGGGLPRLDREIIQTLQFDDARQKRFDVMKHTHHEQMLQSDRDYHDALLQFFNLLGNDSVGQMQYDTLLSAVLRVQKNRAEITFKHFEDLKNLCAPEHRKNFDQLLPVLTQVILPARKDRPRRGNGR